MQKCDGTDLTDDGMYNREEPEEYFPVRAAPGHPAWRPVAGTGKNRSPESTAPDCAQGHSVTANLHFVPNMLHL